VRPVAGDAALLGECRLGGQLRLQLDVLGAQRNDLVVMAGALELSGNLLDSLGRDETRGHEVAHRDRPAQPASGLLERVREPAGSDVLYQRLAVSTDETVGLGKGQSSVGCEAAGPEVWLSHVWTPFRVRPEA
jgi:hypothetical protein